MFVKRWCITMSPVDPQKVALYIRWSTEDQGEGTTLDVQLEGCRHYVLSQGWQVNDALMFVDDGYSGGTLDRPALNRLRRLVAGGEVDCVVVFKLDRLSRSVVDTVNLVLREWEQKCEVRSAREAIDTGSHGGRMFFYTLVSFAEWERSTIRDRTFAGRVRRAQEGRNPGRSLPYGYATGGRPGAVVLVEHEAATVRRIFDRYTSGESVRAIAAALNAEGCSGPRGGRWSGPTVARLLANETYTGKLVFGATTRSAGRRVVREPLVVRENALPAVVTPAEFARARSIREGRPSPSRRQGGGRALASAYLLSGLLECAQCGATMRARPPYDRSHGLYFCLNRFHQGAAVCDCAHIRCPDLDALVAGELRQRYGEPGQREAYLAGHLAGLEGESARAAAESAQVQQRLAALEAEAAHVRRHFRQQAITVAEFRQLTAELEAEAAGLREQQQRLAIRQEQLQAAAGARPALLQAARQVDHWEQLSPTEQKNVLRFFVERVRAYKPSGRSELHCEITWKGSA
jgi:site-specific DNA recombinase